MFAGAGICTTLAGCLSDSDDETNGTEPEATDGTGETTGGDTNQQSDEIPNNYRQWLTSQANIFTYVEGPSLEIEEWEQDQAEIFDVSLTNTTGRINLRWDQGQPTNIYLGDFDRQDATQHAENAVESNNDLHQEPFRYDDFTIIYDEINDRHKAIGDEAFLRGNRRGIEHVIDTYNGSEQRIEEIESDYRLLFEEFDWSGDLIGIGPELVEGPLTVRGQTRTNDVVDDINGPELFGCFVFDEQDNATEENVEEILSEDTPRNIRIDGRMVTFYTPT